jgi:thiol-disulfide isomerase/thioredoxin
MKKYFSIIAVSIFIISSCTVNKSSSSQVLLNQLSKDSRGNDMLLGKCTKEALTKMPFIDWFKPNYDSYVVDSFTCNFIRPLLSGKTITIFMGTWCGDSKREVPRVLKMLECCDFPAKNLSMVMVSNVDGSYKQSPQHEEIGKNLVRVPTIIIEEKGKEIGRIIEFPITSLEKDLLAILKSEKYLPNYHQLKANTR